MKVGNILQEKREGLFKNKRGKLARFPVELDIWHGGLLDYGMVILGMRSYVCVSDVK